MPDKLFLLRVAALVMIGACSPVHADEEFQVNGLPCNALCRAWLGVKLPAPEPAPAQRISREREAGAQPTEPSKARTARAVHKSKPRPTAVAVLPRPRATAVVAPPPAPSLAKAANGGEALQPAELDKIAATLPPPAPAVPTTKAAAGMGDQAATASIAPTSAPTPEPSPILAKTSETPSAANEEKKPERAEAVALAAGSAQDPSPAIAAASAEPAASVSNEAQPASAAKRILIVLAKPDVAAVADLSGKAVVVTSDDLASETQLRSSFAAAGAGGATFKMGATGDVKRVAQGEFAAAIVAVVAPEVAAGFQDIPGYRVLRVDVADVSSK